MAKKGKAKRKPFKPVLRVQEGTSVRDLLMDEGEYQLRNLFRRCLYEPLDCMGPDELARWIEFRMTELEMEVRQVKEALQDIASICHVDIGGLDTEEAIQRVVDEVKMVVYHASLSGG